MPVLDTGIHARTSSLRVDGRDKPGHDVMGAILPIL
jgi:hypothetical protein